MKIEYKLRPCRVEGRKALFHMWANIPTKINNPFRGYFKSHDSTYAIVEFEDGTVKTIDLEDVKFTNNNEFKAIAFD